jgi:hypothetical protein
MKVGVVDTPVAPFDGELSADAGSSDWDCVVKDQAEEY